MALSNTMTLLFTDLVGSTAMGDRLGDDDAETVRRRFFQVIEEAVEPTGGRIVKTMGDGHMVAFASALDAIGCAIAIQGGVDIYNSEHGAEQIGVRIGINAGDVTVEGEDFFGTPVTIAKRLCDSAAGGQILVSGLVESLVGSRGGFAFRTLGALELRGLSRPQAASEVVWRADAGMGDCVGNTVDVWRWLTIDTMWVSPSHRGDGLGRQLLAAVEEQARERGCRWAKLNTWESGRRTSTSAAGMSPRSRDRLPTGPRQPPHAEGAVTPPSRSSSCRCSSGTAASCSGFISTLRRIRPVGTSASSGDRARPAPRPSTV